MRDRLQRFSTSQRDRTRALLILPIIKNKKKPAFTGFFRMSKRKEGKEKIRHSELVEPSGLEERECRRESNSQGLCKATEATLR